MARFRNVRDFRVWQMFDQCGRGLCWCHAIFAGDDDLYRTGDGCGRHLAVLVLVTGFQVDGEFVGRIKADGDGVRADMRSDENILYVYGNSGKLLAYEITVIQ